MLHKECRCVLTRLLIANAKHGKTTDWGVVCSQQDAQNLMKASANGSPSIILATQLDCQPKLEHPGR